MQPPKIRGPYHEQLSTTRLLLMAYITKHSHSIILFPSWGKEGIHLRISIVQLGSIELLYINAQPLHKVKIIKRTPSIMVMQLVLGFERACSGRARWRWQSKISCLGSERIRAEATGQVAEQEVMVTAGCRHYSITTLGRDDDPRSVLTQERRLAHSNGDSTSWAHSMHRWADCS
jgi:hypothetical protein